MVPLLVKEVREPSAPNVDELVEDCGDDRLYGNFEVEAGFARKTKELLKQEASGLLEDGVDD